MSAVDRVAAWIGDALVWLAKALISIVVGLWHFLTWPGVATYHALDPETHGGQMLSLGVGLFVGFMFWPVALLASLQAFMWTMDRIHAGRFRIEGGERQ